MKPSKTKFPRGFTLAEVMLATTIAVIASSAIFTFLIFGLRSNAETVNAIANSDAIRKTTQRLMQDIRAADNSMVLTSINDLSEVDLEREGDVLLLFYNGWDITSSSDKVERYVVYFIDNSNARCRSSELTKNA